MKRRRGPSPQYRYEHYDPQDRPFGHVEGLPSGAPRRWIFRCAALVRYPAN